MVAFMASSRFVRVILNQFVDCRVLIMVQGGDIMITWWHVQIHS